MLGSYYKQTRGQSWARVISAGHSCLQAPALPEPAGRCEAPCGGGRSAVPALAGLGADVLRGGRLTGWALAAVPSQELRLSPSLSPNSSPWPPPPPPQRRSTASSPRPRTAPSAPAGRSRAASPRAPPPAPALRAAASRRPTRMLGRARARPVAQ